jgi:hypothetical protein
MANISKFAGSALAHQGGGYQPQRKDNFAVLITGIQNVDVVALSVSTFTIPELAIQQGKVKHFNETTFYAGSRKPTDSGVMTVVDYIDKDLLAILIQWKRQVYNPNTGAIGWAANYKKRGEVILLPPGTNAAVPGAVNAQGNRKWILEGVWPMSLKYDELNMEDEGTTPAKISLNLSIDRCIPLGM